MGIPLKTRLKLASNRSRGKVRQAISDFRERDQLRSFQQFYAQLPDRQDAVFMFFTSGLLHWLWRSLELIPEDVNVVLIGSDLDPEEIRWLRANAGRRPLHPIATRVDDNTVLSFLFQTAAHNFGWLHIDCFVLNPALFAEMSTLADDVALNCIWSNPRATGLRTVNSAWVFVNHQVLAAVRGTGVEVSPCTYHYQGSSLGRTVTRRKLYSRVPTPKQVELLGRVLPAGDGGLPQYPSGSDYFPLLVVYQLIANALGYRLHHVRDLVRDGSASTAFYSEEVVHVNGVATYRRYKTMTESLGHRWYPLLLQADYTILRTLGRDLPAGYLTMKEQLRTELGELGLSEDAAVANLSGFLAQRGMSGQACARILGLDRVGG